MKISYSDYKNELKKLFKEIFKETDSFNEMIFEKKLSEADIFALFCNDEIACVTYAIHFMVKIKNEIKKCVYIYGVGVKEKYRGRGLSKEILSEIYSYYKDKNISFLYLVPADEGLFKMYEKLGYETAFYLYKKEFDLKNTENYFYNITSGDYDSDYEKYIEKFDTVILKNKTDREVSKWYTTYKKSGESGFLVEADENTVFIRESFIYDENDLFSFLSYLKNKGFDKAVVTNYGNKKIPYAMVKKYEQKFDFENGYTNMNFD